MVLGLVPVLAASATSTTLELDRPASTWTAHRAHALYFAVTLQDRNSKRRLRLRRVVPCFGQAR